MSEKKELNLDELEKVSGGFRNVDDSLIGSTIKLKYYGAFRNVKRIDAYVIEAAELDGYASGKKVYKLNVKNGFAVGWFHSGYVTGSNVFMCKDDIKWMCMSREELTSWEVNNPEDFGD